MTFPLFTSVRVIMPFSTVTRNCAGSGVRGSARPSGAGSCCSSASRHLANDIVAIAASMKIIVFISIDEKTAGRWTRAPSRKSRGREEYSDRLVGFPSRQGVEQFQEAHGGFTIWLDPFGVLDPQVVVDLLPAPGVVDERSCLKRTKWPSQGLPKGGTQVLAVCVMPGQLDDRVSDQSALRERKGRG